MKAQLSLEMGIQNCSKSKQESDKVVISPTLVYHIYGQMYKEIGRNNDEMILAYADDEALICDSERNL